MRLLLICMAVLFSQCATAAVTINIFETNGNVQADLSGSIDLNALGALQGQSPGFNGYLPSSGNISFTSGATNFYGIDVVTWTPLGPGGFGTWDTSSGDAFAMFSNPVLGVPTGYVSGNPLSATATANGTTLAALGFTTGTFVTTLTNNQTTDTVTVIVGPGGGPSFAPAQPVPTLQTWTLLLLAALFSFFAVRSIGSRSRL